MTLIMQYFIVFKAFKALSYCVFVLFYLFFPACPKKTQKPTGLGFFLKTPGFFEPCLPVRLYVLHGRLSSGSPILIFPRLFVFKLVT